MSSDEFPDDIDIPDAVHPIETMFQGIIDKIIPRSSSFPSENLKILVERLNTLELENKKLKEELSVTKSTLTDSKEEIKELKTDSDTKYTIFSRCIKEFIGNNYILDVGSKVPVANIRDGIINYLFKKGYTIQPYEVKKAMGISFPECKWLRTTYNGTCGYYYSGLKPKEKK